MVDFEKFEEQRRQERLEYLKNKKPEDRYLLHDIGHGFIIHDKLACRNNNGKRGYMLLNDYMSDRVRDDYGNQDDFIKLLNDLDRRVNGNLEEDPELLLSKDIVYENLLMQLDRIMNNLEYKNNDSFHVSLNHYDSKTGYANTYGISGVVYRDFLCEYGIHNGDLYDNKIFLSVMKTINKKISEYENKNDIASGFVLDELTELKMSILEDLRRRGL